MAHHHQDTSVDPDFEGLNQEQLGTLVSSKENIQVHTSEMELTDPEDSPPVISIEHRHHHYHSLFPGRILLGHSKPAEFEPRVPHTRPVRPGLPPVKPLIIAPTNPNHPIFDAYNAEIGAKVIDLCKQEGIVLESSCPFRLGAPGELKHVIMIRAPPSTRIPQAQKAAERIQTEVLNPMGFQDVHVEILDGQMSWLTDSDEQDGKYDLASTTQTGRYGVHLPSLQELRETIVPRCGHPLGEEVQRSKGNNIDELRGSGTITAYYMTENYGPTAVCPGHLFPDFANKGEMEVDVAAPSYDDLQKRRNAWSITRPHIPDDIKGSPQKVEKWTSENTAYQTWKKQDEKFAEMQADRGARRLGKLRQAWAWEETTKGNTGVLDLAFITLEENDKKTAYSTPPRLVMTKWFTNDVLAAMFQLEHPKNLEWEAEEAWFEKFLKPLCKEVEDGINREHGSDDFATSAELRQMMKRDDNDLPFTAHEDLLSDPDVKKGTLVLKYGKTTGWTVGTLTGVLAMCKTISKIVPGKSHQKVSHTTEMTVLNFRHSEANVFSMGGDSGAMVYLMRGGKKVGPLFGGNERKYDSGTELSFLSQQEEYEKSVNHYGGKAKLLV